MQTWADVVKQIADAIAVYLEIWVLIGCGLFFTWKTRGVQFRLFSNMWETVFGSRGNAQGGISSFQAFTISLAARVGVGNVFGVAAALLLGGPGAIFWMWVVALVGMATSFMESTLAQIFKVSNPDGSFRGGPAYYMWLGLKKRWFGAIFAIIALVTCGFVITSVQSNAIASTVMLALPKSIQGTSQATWGIAIGLFILAAPVIVGGIKQVARVTEIMAPLMAVVYVLLAVVIIVLNVNKIGPILEYIVVSAFNGQGLLAGTAGGVMAAVINGVQRGLFSNEAGQGTAPNAAATATVSHPIKQGLIQSLGVFIDTIVVCTATAIIILSAPPSFFANPEQLNPATMTTLAIGAHLGTWAEYFMVALIVVLAYSSVIAAYVYSDVNMSFVTEKKWASYLVRLVSVVSVVLGAVVSLPLIWNAVDIAMAVMTMTNLLAICLLYKWATGALRDYEGQLRAGKDPVFVATNNPLLPGDLPTTVWAQEAEQVPVDNA